MSSKEEIRARVIAHNNEFTVGDIINFDLSGVECEGKLVKIIDCVEGVVETKWGSYLTPLCLAHIADCAES